MVTNDTLEERAPSLRPVEDAGIRDLERAEGRLNSALANSRRAQFLDEVRTARNAVTRLVARALLEKPLRGLIRPGGCRKPCLIGISKPQILQGAVSEVGVCQNHILSTQLSR